VQLDYANFTRLNHTKAMIVVNGQFPGPAIRAREGDIVVVNVTNRVASPVTIHWLETLERTAIFSFMFHCPLNLSFFGHEICIEL
jgi:hypothetical protein